MRDRSNKPLLVNYFPGSLGDTVIAYLLGFDSQRDHRGRIRNGYPWDLKEVDFYYQPLDSKIKVYVEIIKPWLDEYNIIGVHRFECFDFALLDDVQVLSIDPRSMLDQVASMYLDKVQSDEGYYHSADQTVNDAIVARYGNNSELKLQLAKKRIIQWCEHNILSSDIVLSLDEFVQDNSCVDKFRV